MLKRRQFLANTAAVTGTAMALPAMVSTGAAVAFTRDTTIGGSNEHRIRLEKGQTLFYVDASTAQRQQISAVVQALDVTVHSSGISRLPILPTPASYRQLPAMKAN